MLQLLGGPVPPNTDHAVSVSLPTWEANVGYEEGAEWVLSKMQCGYPRFFIHPSIQKLVLEIIRRFGDAETEAAMLFPTPKTAQMCYAFLEFRIPQGDMHKVRIVNLLPSLRTTSDVPAITSHVSCVIYPKEYASTAKQVWQHSGSGISSRRSEFCLGALKDGYLVDEATLGVSDPPSLGFRKGPMRYQDKALLNGSTKTPSARTADNGSGEGQEYNQFIEERFGRNLSISLADRAKLAVRRRIAGVLTADVELNEALEETRSEGRMVGLSEDDVFLFPTGMSAIFNTHQNIMHARGFLRSICYGFPYIDSLKILEKWGPGCLFYGHGSSEELDDLESRLKDGERFLALFTEFPGNPLLKSPDLRRIRLLADQYGFAVVVDETVGNFVNVNVLSNADVVVSSLTKIFSGDSNVMGGSAVLNPHGNHYHALKEAFTREYEDLVWAEDAVFLERNSRDFVSRAGKVNATSEAITAILRNSPFVKEVYYPKYSPTRQFYDNFRTHNGGYGGLFSVTFHSTAEAIAFFDNLEVLKGPSLGTNFTLSCPYTLIAHYNELDWARSFGVEADLVRVSVGLEDISDLATRFARALEAVARIAGTK